jgi:hypothetical protein
MPVLLTRFAPQVHGLGDLEFAVVRPYDHGLRRRIDLVWAIALSAAVGCGRLNFDVGSGSGVGDDAMGNGDGEMITVDAPLPCLIWSSFGAPTRMTEVSATGADDWGPYISADNLTMYMFSDRAGSMGLDIWSAKRNDPDGTFLPPALVANVNSAMTERSPWISPDGLTLGFGSTRAGGMGQNDLYWAKRTDVSLPFDPPVAIPNVNSATDEFFSVLSANGLRLYMTVTRLGTLDVFVAERTKPADPFGVPMAIAELNTPQTERHLAISADELEVFIDSDRTGSQGVDIWRATRPNLATPFSTPVLVPELNSAMDEVAPALSADGSTIYYAYNAVLAGGDAEIWFAKRTCTGN